MPDVTETARLIVEAEARGFAETQASIAANQAKLDALTASYRAGSVSLDDYRDEGLSLQAEINLLTAAHTKAEAAVLKYGSTQAASSSLADEAQKSYSQMNQRVTALSYAFQDFTSTSGDFGAKLNSISNNLPAIIGNLGGFGAVLTVAATAGIAVYKNWDSISSLWETRNPYPKAANDVSGLKREFEAAKNELEKMDKAGSGNATQIARYNELRTRTAEIEKEIAAAQERQAQLKKLFEAPTASEAEAQKERVELLGEIRGPAARQLAQDVAGVDNAEVEARVAEGAKAKVAAENERLRAQQAELDWQTQAREVEAIDVMIAQTDARVLEQMKADKARLEEAANTMVAEATLEGKIGPFRQVQKAMAERPEDFRPEQVRAFAQAAPEALKEDQDFDAQMAALTEAGKRRREKAAEAKKADAAADKVIADELHDKLDVLKGTGTVDRIADELTKEVAAGGALGQSAFAKVKEGLDKRLRGELLQGGFEAPAGREDVVAGQVGDLATQAARAARVRAGVEDKKEETTRRTGVSKQQREAMQKANKISEKSFEESMQASGIADFAGGMLAQAQAAGGMQDKFGRFQKMNPGQIEAAVRKQVEAWLHRQVGVNQQGRKVFANPQMGGEETGLTASRIVSDAQKGVNTRVNSLAGANLTNTGKLLNVTQQLLGKLRQQDQQINGMQQQTAAQSRAINALRVDVTPRAHHNRRHGQ